MKKIYPDLCHINRTEHKDWQTKKVKNLLSLLGKGYTKFITEPVYIVRDRYNKDNYFVYDGNTRHFLAEHDLIQLTKFYLIETDSDLEHVRETMQDIYWPGDCLDSVVGLLDTRNYYMERKNAA